MKSSKQNLITLEHVLYILAFGLALSLRLLNLGAAPLSEFESELALRALDLASGRAGLVGTQPAYIVLTGLIFSIFKASEATARFFPAFTGSLLVFIPLLFKSLFGTTSRTRTAGVLFAFAVALDPGLVAASRLVGGPIPALVFSLLAAGFIWQGKGALAGFLAGLAVMSGPTFIEGAVALGLAAAGTALLQYKPGSNHVFQPELPHHLHEPLFWQKSGLFAGTAFLIGGLLWLRFPQGLAELANTIPSYLAGWLQPSGIPALRLPASLLLYQPLAVIFGLAGIFRAWFKPSFQPDPDRFLSLWAGCALILAMIYPSRQVTSTVWALIPLWLLAASELSQHSLPQPNSPQRLPGLSLAGIVAFFIFLLWYNLLRLGNLNAQLYLYAAIIGGLFMMTVIVVILVSLGWGFEAARFGLVWGSSLIMALYMLSAMWGASQTRSNDPIEFWTIAPGTGQEKQLLATLEDLSTWQYGLKNMVNIHTNLTSPGLRWALRNFPNVSYMTTLDYDLAPDVILSSSPQTEAGNLPGYRGQEFIWSRTAVWNGVIPPNLLRWLTFRELPSTSQPIILWARGDLFRGGSIPGIESPTSQVEPVH